MGDALTSERLEAETLVSLGPDGPMLPLALALRENGAFRDKYAEEVVVPSLGQGARAYRRLRLILAGVVALPVVMLVELDRELFSRSGPGRLAVDALLVAWTVFELTRRTPRMPRVAAACLIAIALRWMLIAGKLCGHGVHALVWGAMTLAIVGAGLFLFRVPPPARVAREILEELGVSRAREEAAIATREPPPAVIAAAVACAAGLPAMLHLLRALDLSFVVQAMGFVGFAAAAPILVKRFGERRTEVTSRVSPPRVMLAVAVGLALTAAAVSCGRLFFDVGAEVARCVDHFGAEARLARAVEGQELAKAVARVRASMPLVLMTGIVFPFAEERIYRGLLQDVLTRRLGRTYGIMAASLAFGLAHIGVYEVALYQTVLLGIGFGFAYAEGGILAAFFVHATWNLMQMG